jgi:single-strand DNA-binding protein
MYLNSVTIVGILGSAPEQRKSRTNGAKFTVFSVATQRPWKNAQDEWSSKTEWHRVCIFRPRLAEYPAQMVKKASHVLVEGSFVSSTYDPPNDEGKNAKTAKITSWSIRADAVRKLDRGESELESATPASDASKIAHESSEPVSF